MEPSRIRFTARAGLFFSAALLAAVMFMCIPQGQALAADSQADGERAALQVFTGSIAMGDQAADKAPAASPNAPKQAGTKSKYALLQKNGHVYPCNKKGKKLGKYWKSGTTFKYLFVAPNVTKIPAEFKYAYKGTIKFSGAVKMKLQSVTFMLKKGKNSCKTIAANNPLGEQTTLKTLKNFNKTKVQSIGAYGLARTGLTSISLPKTLKSIGKFAFAEDKKLKTVSGLEKTKVSSIGEDAFIRSAVTKLSLPASLTKIGNEAFAEMGSLTSVAGLEKTKVKAIPKFAFAASPKIATVSLPASCTSVGYGAFYQCGALATLKIPAGSVATGATGMLLDSKIDASTSGVAIRVPASLVNSYKEASYWSSYDYAIKAI